MKLEAKKYLYDIAAACRATMEFVEGRSFEDYCADLLLRSAVERQLEIAGEAMNQLRRAFPETSDRLKEHHGVIQLRNVIIHGD